MSEPNKQEMTDLAFVSAQTDFAVGLLRETAAASNASLILSPISIALALSLAYAGAGGDTRKEFEAVFAKGGTSGDALHSLFRRTLSQLTAADKNVTLALTNRAYAARELDVKAAFKELIAAHYGGDFKQVDFEQAAAEAVKEVNEFVANVTHDKIRDLLSADSVDAQTKLVLVNAVYFKVKMMNMKLKVNYAETADVQVLELPYADEGAKFIAFLPRAKFGLTAWLQKTDGAELLKLRGRLTHREVFISLPRFKITSKFELKDVLDKLGFSKGFSDQADFSGIANNESLKISAAIHKAFIESNEQGSEAAAATMMEMMPMSFDPDAQNPPDFVADHPFAFVIAYHENPLFFGRFSNEKGSEAAAATTLVMRTRSRPPTFRADRPFVFVVAFHDKPLFVGRFAGGN
ncbi:putative serpin-like protein [Aphelenchoides fujianensis]|nr:putative serpin-like protein [Aphelenchoides fujianensis]